MTNKGPAKQDLAYRVESSRPIIGPLLAGLSRTAIEFADRATAVLIAAKSYTSPPGQEIRVVHQSSGEIVVRKTAMLHHYAEEF